MKEFSKDLSIVIPCYNCEKTIEKCLKSIKVCENIDKEILLIDDGSSDNTGKIIKRLNSEIDDLKYFRNSNHGVSFTRNFGIKKSLGKYIVFIDSDDYLERDFFDKMLDNIKDCDISICNYKYVYSNKIDDNLIHLESDRMSMMQFRNVFWMFFNGELINPPWNKIYNNTIINKYEIRFSEALDLGEDLLFNLEYLRYCNKISFINEPLYNYVIGTQTLSTKFRENYLDIEWFLMNKVETFVSEETISKGNEILLIEYRAKVLISFIQSLFLENCNLSTKEKKKHIIKSIGLEDITILMRKFTPKCIEHMIMKVFILRKSVNSIYYFQKLKQVIKSKGGFI